MRLGLLDKGGVGLAPGIRHLLALRIRFGIYAVEAIANFVL